VYNGVGSIEVDDVDWVTHGKSMHATARPNPEATAVTEVILRSSQKATQTGPVRLRHGEVSGEKALAGLIEGLTSWDRWWHGFQCVAVVFRTYPGWKVMVPTRVFCQIVILTHISTLFVDEGVVRLN
jgi:hypothetical protein